MYSENYRAINEQYTDTVISNMQDVLFIASKWREDDYLWPFSDIDYRLVLKRETQTDLFELNQKLCSIQLELQHTNQSCMRILEHPPGFIFFFDEIFDKYFEDFRIWTFAGGDKEAFGKFQRALDISNEFDESYYGNIIAKRFENFSLKTEFSDYPTAKLSVYNVYAALWHYYFPCLFALYSLHKRSSMGHKVDPLLIKDDVLRQSYEFLKNSSAEKVPYHFEQTVSRVDSVLLEVSKELGLDISKLKSTSHSITYGYAIAMLRTRPARLLLYLEEDGIDRKYLAEREINELKMIFECIYTETTHEILQIALSTLYSEQSTESKLQAILSQMYRNKLFYNNLMNSKR